MTRTTSSRTAATAPPPPSSGEQSEDTGDDTDMGFDREYPGTPRWVKVFAIVVIVLVLVVVIVLFVGGHTSPVQHGP